MEAAEVMVSPWHVSRSGRYGWVLASRLMSDKVEAKGILGRAKFLGGGYSIRIGGPVPRQLRVETHRLTDWTCDIRLLEDNECSTEPETEYTLLEGSV